MIMQYEVEASNKGKSTWQNALIHAITDPLELLTLLDLDKSFLPAARKAALLFPLKVTRSFVSKMKKGDINDPLLLQVLPLHDELQKINGYSKDPLQEAEFNPLPGLLHKYHGRVLVPLVGACAINCRFCFRRHFPYTDNTPSQEGWDHILEHLAKDPTISEVIFSGGDPLVVPDDRLKKFTDELKKIPQIKRLRIHSRVPIVLPERITLEFLDWIKSTGLKTVLVIHCNHPRELDPPVRIALQSLSEAGVVLFNQSVLLKRVNDSVDTLTELSETLFDAGVQPYYLHILDKVEGAHHFDLELSRAKKLHNELSSRLSGYLVPKLVCEQPGSSSKTLVFSEGFCTD